MGVGPHPARLSCANRDLIGSIAERTVEMNDTDTGPTSMLALAHRTWRRLAHDWQAVVLGALVVVVVFAGVPIPW